MSTQDPRPERFTRAFRLRHDREFKHVYEQAHRRESGPLLVYGAPNESGHPRLGLSVSRKVGGAVARNKVKRRLREAFRRIKVELSAAFDFVIVVRPHKALTQETYRQHLESAMRKVIDGWAKRNNKDHRSRPEC